MSNTKTKYLDIFIVIFIGSTIISISDSILGVEYSSHIRAIAHKVIYMVYGVMVWKLATTNEMN